MQIRKKILKNYLILTISCWRRRRSNLEEREKDVGLRSVEEAERQQSGHAPVQDCRPDLCHRHYHPLVPVQHNNGDDDFLSESISFLDQAFAFWVFVLRVSC